jgi:hypothetical protein
MQSASYTAGTLILGSKSPNISSRPLPKPQPHKKAFVGVETISRGEIHTGSASLVCKTCLQIPSAATFTSPTPLLSAPHAAKYAAPGILSHPQNIPNVP